MRTKELDLHWSGKFYCNDCKHYTGNKENHPGHNLIFIDNRKPEIPLMWKDIKRLTW